MTVASAKGPKGKADKLFSLIIRSEGECQGCGSAFGLQCAHIIRRHFSWTRTHLDNAWALCGDCHYKVDNYADRKMDLVERTIGLDLYFDLVRLSQCRDKFDWIAEAARLDAIWKEMRAAA